jgi:exopolysaccharide production protein ExoQ
MAMKSTGPFMVSKRVKLASNLTYSEFGGQSIGSSGWNLAAMIIFAYLLFILVGLEPLKERDTIALATVVNASGDSLKQFLSLVFLCSILFLYRKKENSSADLNQIIPYAIQFCIGWVLLSIFWSISPEHSVRKAFLLAIVTTTVFVAVESIGIQALIKVLSSVLALILIVDILAIILTKSATHQNNGFDAEAVVGYWRGVHYHKNVAGSLFAMAALFFQFAPINKSIIGRCFFIGLALVLLSGTGAKAAIQLYVITQIVMVGYWLSKWHPWSRYIFFNMLFILTTVLPVVFVIVACKYGNEVISPDLLTGRGAIWEVAIKYINMNPYLGSGYGAFWQIGTKSPALQIADARWLITTAQTHNGYLQLLSELGPIGLIAAIISINFLPMKLIQNSNSRAAPFCIAWFVFMNLYNMTETRLLSGAREEWVLHLFAVALAYQMARGIGNERIPGMRYNQDNLVSSGNYRY